MTTFKGRCFCGAITFKTNGPVLWSGICHCDSCRRATAAPCTGFFGVRRDSVTWQGTPAQHLSSGGAVQRFYCPDCGTQLVYRSDVWPEETHLYLANLDDPTQVPPQAHFHYVERLPWLAIADDLPKFAASSDNADPL